MTTKAIHLELVPNRRWEACIAALNAA